ncbi:MAG: YHS domain-containing protein [Thaumarchaeota archaeon]|nr:YHS domain-containing protein [Nitrososphaerota archaeon]
MYVEESPYALHVTVNGMMYHFCNPMCKKKFDSDPKKSAR